MLPCPICGATSFQDFSGRADAVCTRCGSLERHRALVSVFESLPESAAPGRCLEVAPLSPEVYGGYLRRRGWRYTCTDKWKTGNPQDPRAVGFIDFEADLVHMPMFADGSFDLVIIQHVIEEIPDFGAALSEIARVLSPRGVALLEIPYDPASARSEKAPPNHFGNLWRFGTDLLDEIRRRLPRLEIARLAQGDYSGDLFVCRPAARTSRGPVFMAHGHDRAFGDDLRALLGHLRREGIRCLSGDEYLAGEDGALLTIDDGHPNDLAVAYPILREFDARAVSFLIPLRADLTPRVVDWDAWRAALDRIEVGSHTLTHTKVGRGRAGEPATGQANVAGVHGFDVFDPVPGLAACEYDPLRRQFESRETRRARLTAEIAFSRQFIERRLGKTVRFFSYPWGAWDAESLAIVREAGYEAAFSVTATDGTRWSVPRINLPPWVAARRENAAAAAAAPSAPPIPPAKLRFMAESDTEFISLGDVLVRNMAEHAGLSPTSRVVDVGCGYGRVAHALLRRPGFEGTYVGMDILDRQIRWCAENLAPCGGGRFAFRFLDVQNGRYNPTGAIAPDEVDLGVPDGEADVVVLTSVFTHMHENEIRHYLREIRRMLAPRGRAYVTFFLLDDEVRANEAAGRTGYPLPYELAPHCRCMTQEDPLHVIAYDERWVLERLAEAGLEAVELHHGEWGGRGEGLDFQDTLILAPTAAE